MKCFMGVLSLLGVLLGGLALADEAIELRPDGPIKVQFRGKVTETDKPLTLALAAKDQLCLLGGQARVVRSQAREERSLRQGECFQASAPRSIGQSFVQFVQGIFGQPRTATATALQSRGGECEKAPAIHIPKNFPLPELLVPASGRPNPKSLKLFDAAGQELLSLESPDDRAIFTVPAKALAQASRVQILNSRGESLYVGDIFRVEFAEALPAEPGEAALALMATGIPDYAHAAYSYLVKAGKTEEAKALESEIRTGFACG